MLDSLASIDVIKREESLESIVVKPKDEFYTNSLPIFTLLRIKKLEGNHSYSEPILVYNDNAVLQDPKYLEGSTSNTSGHRIG